MGMRYATQGEWVDDRKEGEVVIPMIAFIEGGMTTPTGNIIGNYLRFFRLSPTQCALNMLRVLGSIKALNERIILELTHHDVSWVYNLHYLKRQGYYLKSKHLEVRLIQCLPASNKGLKEDFLIFSEGWHDRLPCLTREGAPGEGLVINLCTLAHVSLLFHTIFAYDKFSPRFDDFADRHSTVPQLNLVNNQNLDKILRFEVFVNETDDQLRVAHVIPRYKSISLRFQAPKCVIKANDPRFHRISMAFEGFVVPEGVPILKGTPFTQLLFVPSFQ